MMFGAKFNGPIMTDSYLWMTIGLFYLKLLSGSSNKSERKGDHYATKSQTT